MTTPLLCLLAFAVWTILLTFAGIVLTRVYLVFFKGVPSNAWSKVHEGRGEDPDPPIMKRLRRARANCVENLPIVAPIILTGAMLGVHTRTFDQLAIAFLVLRLCQSTIHIVSTSSRAVVLRAACYGPQLFVYAWMALHVYQKAPAR
jgi:uncharacterized MAPEG superfamily protein